MQQGRGETQYPRESSQRDEGWLEALRGYEGKPENLIPVLQRTQKVWGFLPEWALLEISDHLGLAPAKVYGVATFYAQFRLQPIGKNVIRVCRGTACHVRGSNRILKEIQSRLQVSPGETTKDRLFTLETVACFGSCALAPVMVVNDTVYGRMNPSKAMVILDGLREAGKQASTGDRRAPGAGR